MLTIRVCLGVLIFAGTPALAGELNVPSTISSVIVYPLGAGVVRTANVTLPLGATTVLIGDLPPGFDPDSLKVEGAADNPIAIASVETRSLPAGDTKDPKRTALEDEIQAIQDKIDAADDSIAALEGRKEFLEKLIDATPNGFSKALGEGGDGVAQWAAAATTIGDGLAAVADAERAARLEQRSLGHDIEERQKALAALPAPADHMAVRIALSTDAPTTGTLSISYRTQAARWLPTYDAQLLTGDKGGKPSLAIVRRAEVTQATGEDWTNVALTLSTAETTGGTAAPELDPFLVSLYDPEELRSRTEAAGNVSSDALAAAPAPKSVAEGDTGVLDSPAKFIEAAADFGDFRAEYRVPGRVSVETGVGARSLQIATEHVDVALAVRAVPMLSDAAYLQASFTPKAGAPFLAGKVALFRDGTFVGNGAVAFTNPGKPVDLGFGVDDRVHVVRTVLERRTGETGILSTRKTDLRRFKITVDNLHSQPIDIMILDRVPYAEDENVTIERIGGGTDPTATDVDDKRGVLAWRYTYAAGETRDILNGYEVSWPAGQEVVSID